MKTVIKRCLSGAKTASGIVVIIDVFRSSNTILMLLARGAASVIPVATVREATALKNQHPDHLLAGERKGIKVAGFDMGNSPYEATKTHLVGKHVILTTSAGTQAIWHAKRAESIVVGSFGNADALVRMLKQMNPLLVTWLAVGTEGVSGAIEDELCAAFLKGMLEGEPQDIRPVRVKILTGEGADRLRRLGQENDFSYCLTTNMFKFVPEIMEEGGRYRIHRRITS
ncbi:MAG TPA: 2-phosphosulfolactate phosphatase [Desulfobacterales bacterium]|nr:2-phosphosulfolactate phosphatase [Desulfobacterales bacterium]